MHSGYVYRLSADPAGSIRLPPYSKKMPGDIPGAPSFPKFQTVPPSTFLVFSQHKQFIILTRDSPLKILNNLAITSPMKFCLTRRLFVCNVCLFVC